MPQLRMQVGTSATRSVDSIITITRDVDNAVAGNGHAFSDSSVVDRSGGVAYNSFDARIIVQGTQSYDHFAQFQAGASLGTSGTTTNLYGLVTVTDVSAGVVTNAYDLYGFDPTGAGTIVNNYGLYIASKLRGSTLNYAIYTNLGKVRFGDEVTAEKSINGTLVGLRVRNANGGSAAFAQISIGNDQGPNAGGLGVTSSTYTPAAFLATDCMYLTSQRPGGLVLSTEHASAVIKLSVQNGNFVAQFDRPATSGLTGMMLWDTTSGTLRRVKVGAAALADALAFV